MPTVKKPVLSSTGFFFAPRTEVAGRHMTTQVKIITRRTAATLRSKAAV
jgi:hypothetical protein